MGLGKKSSIFRGTDIYECVQFGADPISECHSSNDSHAMKSAVWSQ